MKIVQTSWQGQKIQKRKNWRHSKKITLGTIIYKNRFLEKYAMTIEDIKRHTLIYGQTGTGKSSFLMYFLKQFSRLYSKTPFTLFEFKGEYELLNQHITDLQVLKPGHNFSINLFDKDIFSSNSYVEI
ncbi:MAG: helicase HerA domain-containing protein, partial [Promethearchaeota archaeon]